MLPRRRIFLTALIVSFGCAVAAGGLAQTATASSLIEQGNEHWTAGRFANAQQSYEQAIERDPRSVDAHMKLAGLLLAQQRFAAGAKAFQRAIALDPNNDKAFVGLAIAYLHGGERELSQAALREALRINPGRAEQLRPILERLEKP